MVKLKLLFDMKEIDLLKIINIILEEEGENPLQSLDPSTHLKNDLGFDSMMLAYLTVLIEDQFGVDIFLDGIINTIQEIYDKVNR